MASKKMLIEVELVPVMISIIAEPGDKLMMLNGICIGVDTSREVAPVPMPRRALSVDNAIPVKPRKSNNRGRPGNYKADSFSEQSRAALLASGADGKARKFSELCANMSTPIKGVAWHAINTLVRDGKFKKVSHGRYAITAKPAKAGKPPTYHDNRLMLFREMKAIGIEHTRLQLDMMIAAEEFPRSIKVGTTRKWRRSEVEAWVLNRQAA